MSVEPVIQPSQADRPDLDWSQVRETVMMLNVAIGQIENALRSGDESVTSLADSFTSMVGNVEIIAAASESLPVNEESTLIQNNCKAVSEKMHAAIIAFQFYDKLTQRLTHLCKSLSSLSDVVQTPEQLYSPYAWRGLQERIKSKYTVESDKAMFEAILSGKSVEEALAISKQMEEKNASEDDIELF